MDLSIKKGMLVSSFILLDAILEADEALGAQVIYYITILPGLVSTVTIPLWDVGLIV